MTRKARFHSSVTGWATRYRHPLGHEYVLLAPTRTALEAIIEAGIKPVEVWQTKWLKRAQLVKPKQTKLSKSP